MQEANAFMFVMMDFSLALGYGRATNDIPQVVGNIGITLD